jgi:gliding motility-associated-like protein
MKIKISKILMFMLLILSTFTVKSQITYNDVVRGLYSFAHNDSLKGFDENLHKQIALQGGFFGTEYNVYMFNAKRTYIAQHYKFKPQNDNSGSGNSGYGSKPGGPGGNQVNAAPCVNEDFEASPNIPFTTVPQGGVAATPAGWTGNSGVNGTTIGNTYWTSCLVANHPGITQPVQEVWVRQTPIADPNFPGGIPNSPLGGTKVLQLNDNLAQSGRISQVRQTFPVTVSNALFQFAYAACFDGTGHLCCDQPFLNIKVKNCQNQVLACPQVTVIASGPSCTNGTPGFATNTFGYLYKNWSIQSIDLTPYIGSCVTIEVTVGDCTGWAHFGYCYFDAVCKPITLQVNNNFFPAGSNAVVAAGCGTNTAVMIAPVGLGPYTWNGPTGTSNSQTLTTATAGVYTLTMNPPGSCAPIVKTVSLSFGANPTAGFTSNNVCNNYTFTNTGSAAPAIQTYSFIGVGAPASFTTTNPSSSITFTTSGTYTIQQVVTNTIGCTATQSMVVNIPVGPTLTAANASICPGGNANLLVSGANTYTWTGPNLSNANIANPVANPSVTTVYSVSGTNGAGCVGTRTLQVLVYSSPTITVNSPSLCAGSSSIVTATGATSYTWSPAAGLSNTNIANPSASPIATTIYTIVGTGTNGCTSSQTSTVTVNPLPVLSITSATTCAGINTTISASGASTYSWSTNALTASITAAPLVNTTYTVTGTSAFGCKSTGVATISIAPGLVVNLGSNSPICTNGTLNLTSNIGTIWNWTGPNSFTSNVQNPSISTVSVSNSGTYSINVTDAFGCTGSASINVVVNPLPNPNIVTNSPICANQNLTFNGSGGTSYSWSGPGFTSNVQNPSINGAVTGNSGTYTLTVVDANNCTNSITANVTVNPLPIVTAFGSTVCTGVTASLTSNGGVNYSWSGPLGYTSSSQNPVLLNGNMNMSGNYVVTVTDINGCVNAAIANLIVVPPFTVALTNNSPICQGYTLNMSAPLGYGYSWSGPNGFYSNLSAPYILDAQPVASGQYTVMLTDAAGCKGSAVTDVIVNPNPVLSIVSTKAKCAPACITFTCNSTNTISTLNWWFMNGATVGTSTTTTQCFSKGGIYTSTVTVTDNNGCEGITSHSIEIFPTPVADFNYAPLKPIENTEVVFTDASFGANINVWQWFFNSQSMNSSLQNPIYTYTEAGTYPITLIVRSDKGCMDTITKIIVIGEDYGIYVPNAFTPNGDGLNDVFFAKGYGIVKFELNIFDRWGENIFTSNDIRDAWDGKYRGVLCKDDTYVWKINLTNVFGKSHELKGHVTLIK